MKSPEWIRENDRAITIYRAVTRHLRNTGGGDRVDAEQVAVYAHAMAEYESISADLSRVGYMIIDSKGDSRRNPMVMIANKFHQTAKDQSKLLGIDRSFRLKGKEKQTGLGKTTDRAGRLRKIAG
ncbi:MAG: P27 family phage terminase small subunit [Bacteroidota bacterium]